MYPCWVFKAIWLVPIILFAFAIPGTPGIRSNLKGLALDPEADIVIASAVVNTVAEFWVWDNTATMLPCCPEIENAPEL
jgi:hypothetical protein